jgi:dTDP-4-dehydrorhamnose reductase
MIFALLCGAISKNKNELVYIVAYKRRNSGMEVLKEIANVSGKSGLYRILKPSRAGVIVESLNAKKEKSMIGPTARVSVLKDVSIFTGGAQESVPLAEVFLKIKSIHGDKVALVPKEASDKDLIEFLDEVLPDFDHERVYASDIKKIITWYNLLVEHFPDSFEETTVSDDESSEAPAGE